MDIKSIMDDGLKINANCSFETFRLHEDGFDRDAHANRTLLNIEFTREYFDEETDDYHKGPFVGDLKTKKNNMIYRLHSYHTKVPYEGIKKLIEY